MATPSTSLCDHCATDDETIARSVIGEVKQWDEIKGYGFVLLPESLIYHLVDPDKPDIFVHHAHVEIKGRIGFKAGERVIFTLVSVRGRGLQARNVRRYR